MSDSVHRTYLNSGGNDGITLWSK